MFTQKRGDSETLWHRNTFTHKRFFTRTLLHTKAFTHKHAFTHNPFTHRRSYTQTFTHRRFYTQTLLHTDAFTHQRFYKHVCTQTRLHRGCKIAISPEFLTLNLISCERAAAGPTQLAKKLSVFDTRTLFRAKGLPPKSQFYISFW